MARARGLLELIRQAGAARAGAGVRPSRDGREMKLVAPLPQDMQNLLDDLRGGV